MKKIVFILTAVLFSIFSGVAIAAAIEIPEASYFIVPVIFAASFITMPAGLSFTAYSMVNVAKPDSSAPGMSQKHHILYVFRMDDVTIPARDGKGVLIAGDITPADSFMSLYLTPCTQKWSSAPEGDADSRATIQTLEGDFPNYGLAIAEFMNNNLNENLGAVLTFCDDTDKKLLFGSKCAPLQLSPECTDDAEKAACHLVFKSTNKGPVVARYTGAIDLGSGSGSVS